MKIFRAFKKMKKGFFFNARIIKINFYFFLFFDFINSTFKKIKFYQK